MIVCVRFAPWWIACFNSAVDQGLLQWAHWLANNPSVEVECL